MCVCVVCVCCACVFCALRVYRMFLIKKMQVIVQINIIQPMLLLKSIYFILSVDIQINAHSIPNSFVTVDADSILLLMPILSSHSIPCSN